MTYTSGWPVEDVARILSSTGYVAESKVTQATRRAGLLSRSQLPTSLTALATRETANGYRRKRLTDAVSSTPSRAKLRIDLIFRSDVVADVSANDLTCLILW